MLVLVEGGRQGEVVFFGLRVDGLGRQQGDFAAVEQLEYAFDLEGGRAAGELAFLAALFDRDAVDRVLADECCDLRGEQFDVAAASSSSRAIFLVERATWLSTWPSREATAMIASLPLISMPQSFMEVAFFSQLLRGVAASLSQ